MVYLDNIDIRIVSKLLPESANKCILRTRLVAFCFLFQRGNYFHSKFYRRKTGGPVSVESLRRLTGLCVLGKSSPELDSPG